MVLIFSRVQRCCIKGAPKGYYGYKEEFDAPAELAKQLVEANVAGYFEKKPVPKPGPAPEPEQPSRSTTEVETAPVEESEPEPVLKGNKKRR